MSLPDDLVAYLAYCAFLLALGFWGLVLVWTAGLVWNVARRVIRKVKQ